MIRVAMDARRLQDDPLTGVGRRIANLVPYLSKEVELVLLTDRRRPTPALPYRFVPLSGLGSLPEPAWLQVSVSRWLRQFDGVFHGTYNAIPFAYRGPAVVTIHDLSWEHHPEDLGRTRRRAFALQARWSAVHAKRIVAVSEHARQSIIATYGIDPERVVVAPPSVDPVFSPARAADAIQVLERLGVNRPFVLALGGARRRGLEVAVGAWRRLPAAAGKPQLVVVGGEEPPPDRDIINAGRLGDASWAALLASATVFCYPTRFEGYGMPALEAAASGAPVVCARVGPLPEVLGEAAEWCATPTIDAVASGLERVLLDPARAETLRQAGLARAAQATTWEQCASVVAGAYRAAWK